MTLPSAAAEPSAVTRAAGHVADDTHRHRDPTRRGSRAHTLITTFAVAIGLWLGLTAPSTSPVTPAPPARTAATAVTGVGPANGPLP